MNENVLQHLLLCIKHKSDLKLVESAARSIKALFRSQYFNRHVEPSCIVDIVSLLKFCSPEMENNTQIGSICEIAASVISYLCTNQTNQDIVAQCDALPSLATLLSSPFKRVLIYTSQLDARGFSLGFSISLPTKSCRF